MAIIYTYPVKASPAADDLILISDSADSNKTKQIKVSDLPSSGAGITLTTTGTSGVATLTGSVLNIPNYTTTGGTPATPLNSVQFNNASAFGGSANLTFATDTLTLAHKLDIKGDGTSNAGKLKLYCQDNTTPHYVELIGPAHSGSPVSYSITLPNKIATQSAVSGGRVLEVDASGVGNWITTPASTAPQGDDGQYQYKNGSSFAGSDALRFDSDKIHIGKSSGTPTRGQLVMYGDGTNASDIQLYNSGNNRFLKIAQQAGATQDLTLTFPGVAPGGNTKILQSDSSGQLSWIDTPSGGSGISFSGTTANGIATYSSATTANVSSNLTIDNANKKLSIGSTYSIQDLSGAFNIGSLSSTQAQENIAFYINGSEKVRIDEDGRLVSSAGTAANPNLKFGTGNDGIYGTSNTVQIVTNGTSKISVADGNTADIQMNDLVEFGYGLRFGGSGSTLSTYTEATWTGGPTLTFSVGGAATLSASAGSYRVIGDMVFAQFQFTFSSGGYGTADLSLPVSGVAGTGSINFAKMNSSLGNSTVSTPVTGDILTNAASIRLQSFNYDQDSGSHVSGQLFELAATSGQPVFQSGDVVSGTIIYRKS